VDKSALPEYFVNVLCFTEGKHKRDDLVDPYWIEDRDLKRGQVDFLSSTELQFWKDLLAKYLYPIDEDKNERVCHIVLSQILI